MGAGVTPAIHDGFVWRSDMHDQATYCLIVGGLLYSDFMASSRAFWNRLLGLILMIVGLL
jgi:hypothetical protein